jgi:hypothetical protein
VRLRAGSTDSVRPKTGAHVLLDLMKKDPHFSNYRSFIDDLRTGRVLTYTGADGQFADILGIPVVPIPGYCLHRPSPN